MKYLGVLFDENLSWKPHIDYTSTKVSKGIGIVARLRHLVSFSTLLNIYRSLIKPYISCGLVAWGQAVNTHLNKIVTLCIYQIINLTVRLFLLILGFYRQNCFTSNRLPLCYMTLLIIARHLIFLNSSQLQAPHRFTPIPHGLQ